jgi:hypothetical protein
MCASLFQLGNSGGVIDPALIADLLRITVEEIAGLCGLPQGAIRDQDRIRSASFQERLRDLVLILDEVQPWCGSLPDASTWYRSEPIPSLGDATAEDLVKAGKGKLILSYLARIEQGGYA